MDFTKTVNNYWTRLSKISWLSVASRTINHLPKPKAEAIDLWDTDKSRYFEITEFNNCFIIRSPSLFFFFNEYPWEVKKSAIFMQERSQEGEKHGFLYTWAEYYLQPNTVGRHCTWAQTIICRQLFAGHLVGSWPMKRNKNLLQMIIIYNYYSSHPHGLWVLE